MTAEQKAWLDARRGEGYRPMGALPGGCRWVKRGMLHPDGIFELLLTRNARPSRFLPGSFEVAVLELTPAAPDMRGP